MNTVQSRIVRRLQAAARTVYSLRPDVRSAAWLLAAGILCASDVGFGRMSLGASLLAACPSSALAACCLGVLAGSAAVFGLPGCLGPCAVAAAVLCARLLAPKKYTGAASAAAAAVAEILTGLYGLFLARFSLTSLLLLGAHAALSAGAVILFRAALVRGAYAARVAAVCTLLPALASFRLPGGWSAAAVALAWAVWGSTGTVYACIGCAVMAALAPASAACFACLGVAALIGQALASKPVPAAGIACGIYAVFGIRTAHPGFIVCAAAGTALALVLPPDRFLPRPAPTKLPATPAQRELRRAAAAMRLASDMLHTREADPRRTFAALAEAGAQQVCRSCARSSVCRKTGEWAPPHNAAQILTRGVLSPEDLPLLARCIHPEALRTAVNDALDLERSGQRIRRRLREVRQAARDQYTLTADLLEVLSARLYAPDSPVHFSPEIAVQAAGRDGSAVSGDRGAAFAGPDATYYVLLCDGMGSGESAARESRRAVELLRSMLLSGAGASSALRALNGLYLLRDDGCFSTVDLLRINLTSGAAILYKWGGSASYLKRGRGLRTLGGAGLPPGLDADGASEHLHFSLEHGAVLVLLSDGLAGEETRRRLERCESLVPRDVARSLFAGRAPGADDCTAVCIRLRRVAAREHAAV